MFMVWPHRNGIQESWILWAWSKGGNIYVRFIATSHCVQAQYQISRCSQPSPAPLPSFAHQPPSHRQLSETTVILWGSQRESRGCCQLRWQRPYLSQCEGSLYFLGVTERRCEVGLQLVQEVTGRRRSQGWESGSNPPRS